MDVPILQNHMLTDESINIAQNLLGQQFPEIDGFFDRVVGQMQSFPVMKSLRKYIQILHTGNLHWVCTANLDDKRQNNASSDLYDSLNSGSVSLGVACQMAAYSICPNSELEVKIKRLTGFCEIAKYGFCEIKKIWILRNKKNLDFAKSTFSTTFIKSGFCEMKKKYLDFAK